MVGGSRSLQLVRKRVEAGLAAHEIDSSPVYERENPGRRLSAEAVEARGLPPHGEERLLDRVFGEHRVAHRPAA